MNKKIYKVLCLNIFLTILSCERHEIELIIHNSSWPEGTIISLIHGDRILSRSSLYGGHVRLRISQNNMYRIRAASRTSLTFLSEPITFTNDKNSFILPSHLPRKRRGTWRLGLSLCMDSTDSLYEYLLKQRGSPFTTLSPDLMNNTHLKVTTRQAHAKGIEITACVPVSTQDLPHILSLADSAVAYGVDGIVVEPDSVMLFSDKFDDRIRELANILHARGLTFSLRYTVNCDAGHLSIPQKLRHILSEIPVPEQADELRISFLCDGISSTNSTESIEEKISELQKEHIPLSRISIELLLSAYKFRILDNNDLRLDALKPGELQELLRESGGSGIIRLRDGSLRFGYRGMLYVFDDDETVTQKISLLRTGIFSRSGGIHIVFDDLGVAPDSLTIMKIAQIMKLP